MIERQAAQAPALRERSNKSAIQNPRSQIAPKSWLIVVITGYMLKPADVRLSSTLPLTLGAGLARFRIFFDEFNNLRSHIDAGGFLDAFQTGGGVYLHDNRAVV